MREELENKLNKEYTHIGTISIKELHEEAVKVSDIEYIADLMIKIKPLKSNEPVVLAKDYSYKKTYKIIDGYHRIKDKILKKEGSINAIILDNYSIKRKSDTLFSFLENLVGKEITFISSNLLVADSKYYEIKENEGCGGCSNGWSSVKVLTEFLNKKTKIKEINSVAIEEDIDKYDLVINDKKIAEVDTGWGNGYYGGDFELNLVA